MPSELKDIEVDEVSLVDHPATGKRFTLFKRSGVANRIIQGALQNICSRCSGDDDAIRKLAERLDALEGRPDTSEIAKNDTVTVTALNELAGELDKRLRNLEETSGARQSADPHEPAPRLWNGVL